MFILWDLAECKIVLLEENYFEDDKRFDFDNNPKGGQILKMRFLYNNVMVLSDSFGNFDLVEVISGIWNQIPDYLPILNLGKHEPITEIAVLSPSKVKNLGNES